MTARIPLSARFTAVALLILATAVPALAGPLPLPVLDGMRARTVSSINDAESRIKHLNARIAVVTEHFNNRITSGVPLAEGTYEKLLGDYWQETAELSAQVTGQQAVIASLSAYLNSIDEQISCWRQGDSLDRVIGPAKLPPATEAAMRRPITHRANSSLDWLKKMIVGFESEPVSKPPRSIVQYTFDGQTVYYIAAPCCDQISLLYDADGGVICAPDGGFAGGGDGRCPGILDKCTDEVLVWSDSRS